MLLPKTYEPSQYEPNVYALWESSNSFAPTGVGEPYSIVMPPPNANGNLHIGHGLTFNLQDILIRYERMRGKDALYIPGADHAGFETWVVFEKALDREGKSRFDYSRGQLYGMVWDFVDQQRGNMELQLRALGISASWKNSVFTLDEKVVETVYSTFKKLWDDELIYRGNRIVNYCTYHQTSFADIEVEHRDEKSKLWYIDYQLASGEGKITVATTRPETLLGDTAVAVNPNDDRYAHLIGSKVVVPVVNREVPIIADEAIDASFGTGAVKITPAHDPVDFEIGQRHDLPQIEVISLDGKITDVAPSHIAGLDALEARQSVVDELKNVGLLEREEDYSHSVGHCYKCGTPIQPLIKDQWFLRVAPLAERAKQAIQEGKIKFTPVSKGAQLVQYLDNLHDWNLSRQIPWGIPIPAFQNADDPDDWIFDERVDQPQITVDGKTYVRDEDTFDTWFSSGQWPFIVTDAIRGGELAKYYPTDMMETGHDLLDRWVSRMIMLGLYATDEIPFKQVYMHGMVLDEHGQKMSKSKGNVINPMEVIDQYGSDALRLGIVSARSAGQNQAFSQAKVIAGRNFCNKLWNIARYVESVVENPGESQPQPETLADHWVIRQLMQAKAQVESNLATYRFAEAVEVVYHTIWNDVADWYIESSKQQTGEGMLGWVLETCLKLAHPFAPFVTETIWTTLKWHGDGLLIRSTWPTDVQYHEIAASEFEQLQSLVTETRFVANELPGGKQTLVYEHDSLIADNAELIARLARLQAVERIQAPKGLRLAVPNREAWLDVPEDVLYEHQAKLEARLVDCRANITKLEARLTNKSYIQNAPESVVEETRKQLESQAELERKLVAELEVI